MARWFDRFLRRATPKAPTPGPIAAPLSQAEDQADMAHAFPAPIPLPNATPFAMLHVYRYLRDAIPDISDGIWTWKRLCHTGFDIELTNTSSDVAKRRARRLLDSLNRRVNSGDRGMDGLLDIFYTSLFTYGAAAFEIVLSPSRAAIWDVVPVDVWTVRFRREAGKLQAYQLHQGEEIRLPMERFIYVGLDRDGTNPYGRSMLRAIPLVARIQQRLLEDMAKAMRNTGWSRLHYQYAPGESEKGESADAFRKRVRHEFGQLKDCMAGLDTDQNIVTFDNVKIDVLQGGQRAQTFYDNLRAVEEQVITAMHLMPILLGRNYGTTETYGTAQFEIITRHVEGVNRSVKRILERLYNFELALMWGEATAKVHMRGNQTVDILKAAQARKQEIDNALSLHEKNLIDREKLAALLKL